MFSLAFRYFPVMTKKLFEASTSTVYLDILDLLKFIRSRIIILENIGDPLFSVRYVIPQSHLTKFLLKKTAFSALTVCLNQ